MVNKLSVERKAENEALVELLAEKCEEATQPLNIEHEVKKFIRIRGSDTNLHALKTFVQRYKETVRKITDKGKRARQLFCLGVLIHEDLMKELEKHANVILDANRKIVKYESHDGSIALEGDHSQSSKIKNATMDHGAEEEDEDDEPEPPVPKRSRVSESSQATSSTSSSLRPSASKQSIITPASQRARAPDNLPSREPVNAPRSAPASTSNRQPVSAPRPSNTPDPAPQPNIQVKTENLEEVKPVVQQQQTFLSASAHKSFLELIQSLILTLKIPINEGVWKMEKTIDKLSQLQMLGRQMEEEVKIEDFQNIIISGVNIAKKNSSPLDQEDLRSFKEFVLLLKMSVTHLRMREMDELIEKLENIMEEPENLEKKIPVCKIEKALETVMEILL
ncbi:hypothetical protein CAEBREN_04945 [Caenorhabditis brenneri]|uniref:SPK domain-containing protein n=1 Tax=Caenorhabditis brenneri TaxID=135651 RepID=G0NDC5_CAEBE|nr:hypothetical protein CAEBREN_04945 [Caenorhabditis brenneri]